MPTKAETTTLAGGGKLRVSELRTTLELPASTQWQSISSAVLNGGVLTNVSHVINSKTAADYDGVHPDPVSLLRGMAQDEGFTPASTVGLLTAASMKTCRTSTRAADGVVVDVIVTCGVSNARAAGADADFLAFDDSAAPEPGTINTIVVTNATLTAPALVEAHALAIESKCAECAELGLGCAKSPGRLAQGTGTDATVLIAARRGGRHVKYAGKHTLFAELLGQAVREATRAALLAGVAHLHGGVARYRLQRCARRAAAALQGARPCVPASPSSPVPSPPPAVVAVGLLAVALCYVAPVPRAARVLLAAVAWDRWLGEPPLAVHPVVLVGALISAALRRAPPAIFARPAVGLACGAAFALGVLGVALLGARVLLLACRVLADRASLLEAVAARLAPQLAAPPAAAAGAAGAAGAAAAAGAAGVGRVAAWLVEVVLVKSTIGGQLLGSVAAQMARLLERQQLPEARAQLSWLCSRDPSSLGAEALTGGTLESLAENLSDGVVAPLLWCAACGPLGALGYRVANTLDSRTAAGFKWGRPSLTTASHSKPWAIWRRGAHLSTRKASEAPWAPPLMPGGPLKGALHTLIPHCQPTGIGYHGKFEWFGKPAARFDDLTNLAPARLTALLLVAAAAAIPGCDGVQGLRAAWRDCARCESPNAGWPMAAMAGILGVRLEKAGHYSLGLSSRPPRAQSIRAGLRAFQLACGMATALAVALSACLHPGSE